MHTLYACYAHACVHVCARVCVCVCLVFQSLSAAGAWCEAFDSSVPAAAAMSAEAWSKAFESGVPADAAIRLANSRRGSTRLCALGDPMGLKADDDDDDVDDDDDDDR